MMFRLLPDDVDIPLKPDADGKFRCKIYPEPPRTGPQPRPKSSRDIARDRAKAAEAERVAAEAGKLRAQVHRSLKPLPGKLWSLHPDALLLVGPDGGIPIPATAVPVLAPLAAGGRQPSRAEDRATLLALAGRLAAVGLRIDRRKKGWRIARTKSAPAVT